MNCNSQLMTDIGTASISKKVLLHELNQTKTQDNFFFQDICMHAHLLKIKVYICLTNCLICSLYHYNFFSCFCACYVILCNMLFVLQNSHIPPHSGGFMKIINDINNFVSERRCYSVRVRNIFLHVWMNPDVSRNFYTHPIKGPNWDGL